ncbi:MAG TPA: hypothetical protein VLI05_05975 [Candidatus Saccharimonadia bacterium]|nr:hypothetical protein [Candidatus Saccharimonadia bacterium]
MNGRLHKAWRWGLLALPYLICLGLFIFVALLRVDLDFGWHYRTGQYIFAHGIPYHDIYTYTARDFAWINHEWLNDVLVFVVKRWLGWPALAVLFAGMWALALGLATLWRLPWPMAALALLALLPYVGVRPIAWSALLFALVLSAVRRPGAVQRLWWLPPVFALWANLHGGFILGLAVLGVYAVVRRSWRMGVLALLCGAAAGLNPYGFNVYVEIWRTLSDGRLHSFITEWAPLTLSWANAGLMAGAVVVLALRADWATRLIGGGLLLSCLSSNRQAVFVVVAMLGPLAEAYRWGLVRLERRLPAVGGWLPGVAGAVGGLALLGALVAPPASSGQRVVAPSQAVISLEQQPCAGHVFNDYDFGGYLIGRRPTEPVYIDGRMPSWSGPEGRYLDRWLRVLQDPGYADSEFARYNVRCVLIRNSRTTLMKHLRATGWRVTARDEGSALWRN